MLTRAPIHIVRSLSSAAKTTSAATPLKAASPFQESTIDTYKKLNFDDSITADDPEVRKLRDGILAGHRASLARAITIVESKNARKRAQGHYLLKEIMAAENEKIKKKGTDAMIFRIGISGSPGVGKSTFIESLGMELADNMNKKVAVLTVDPTSQTTGGSILGDLTRMQYLSRHPNAYIRQSPTSGSLGGVTRGIHEAIILCEGAGYDVVLIETVGVGQSEVAVNGMCDLFCLLLSPAHGDELQGVKRGIMEQSDLLIVTKADGELESRAKLTQAEYISALKFMRPKSDVWKPKVMRASVYKPETIEAIVKEMYNFWDNAAKTGYLVKHRNDQLITWMWSHVKDEIINLFKRHPDILRKSKSVEYDIRQGRTTPGIAAESLLRTFFGMPDPKDEQKP
uniref:Methylmalonic aciduria type A protein, mitochondrial n=1 Tax=Panagrellus redivivus TaxID=6233 RepID=A0A7E4W646_PANRE